MENVLTQGSPDDSAEAIQALDKSIRILARMLVKALVVELLEHERISAFSSIIATSSPSVGELDNQKKSLVFSVSEAAKLLGVSRGTAYNLVQTGQIPCLKWGKRILIPRMALMKLLEEVGTIKSPKGS